MLTRIEPGPAGVVDPDEVKRAIYAEDTIDRNDSREQRAGNDTAHRGSGPNRARAQSASSRRRRPNGGRDPDQHSHDDNRLTRISRAQIAARPDRNRSIYVGTRAKLKPWREGGTGGDSASETQPTDYPFYLEGGTPNVLGIAGLAAGIEFVMERGLDAIERHETELTTRLEKRLQALPDYELFGVNAGVRRVGTLSFRHRELSAAEIGGILDESFSVAVRPGLHCAPYIHRALGTFPDGTVRASPGPFSTIEDIDAFARHSRKSGRLRDRSQYSRDSRAAGLMPAGDPRGDAKLRET